MGGMTFTSMVQSKFLDNPEDLGIVAVGFSGGQVRSSARVESLPFPSLSLDEATLTMPSRQV